MVGPDDADGHDVLRRHDHGIGRHRHNRIEVARSQRVGEVAEIVGEKGVHQGELRPQCGLEQVRLAVDLDLALALRDECADAGRREHAAEAAATGPDTLDKRALGNEIERDLVRQHLLLCLWVEPDMGSG